jgi:transcriptional regulator with XRE-family HTH domain
MVMGRRKVDLAPMLSRKDREGRARRLGALIREARGDLTQEQLAKDLRMSLSTLRKVEQGQIPTPGFWLVAAIGERLGLRLEEFLVGERKPLEQQPPLKRPAHKAPRTPKNAPRGVWVGLVGGNVRVRPGDRIRVEGLVQNQKATIHVEPLERFEIERSGE